jgi:hypothetical protein
MPTKHNVKRKTITEKGVMELVKILDKVFSEYIRLKDTDDNGNVKCITCGQIHYWKDIDCGHFIPRARQATRFDPVNCNPQCKKCNRFKHGEHDMYRWKLITLHGRKQVEQLEKRALMGGSYDTYTLREMIAEYRQKVKQLKKEKENG